MPAWLEQYPWWVIYGILLLGSVSRGQATYWLARYVTGATAAAGHRRNGWRSKFAAWLEGPRVARGRAAMSRYGLPLIALCYLTVGFQTVVIASCGVLRVPWGLFSIPQFIGSLMWATIYSTIGFAAWGAAVAAAAGKPWFLAGFLIVLALVVGWRVFDRSRRRAGASR